MAIDSSLRIRPAGPVLAALSLASLLACNSAKAQETAAETPAKPQEAAAPAPVTCIVGGDVWTVTHGVIKNGVVIIRGAKIEKVGGSDLAVPAGATIVHAEGKVVAPGFVADGAQLGGAVQPGNRLRDSLDPYSLSVSLAAASGVTSVYLSGTGAGGRRPGGGGGGGRFAPAAAADGNFSTNNIVVKMTEGDLDGMPAAESTVITLSLESARGGFGGFGGPSPGSRLWRSPAQARPLSQRRSGDDESLSAWRGVRHR